MTFAVGPFPDVEILLRQALLNGLDIDGLSIGTKVPADPGASYGWLPFVRIDCFGGSDDRVTDTSRVSIDAFASTQAAAAQLAESVRQLLNAGPCSTDEGVLDRAVTNTKPNQVPYGDETRVIRYTAAYTVTARRQITS